MFEKQKEYGLIAAEELGQRIIYRAKHFEEAGGEFPFLIAEINTLREKVQLQYIGRLGDSMTFSLVDIHSPEGGCHGYPHTYLGDAGAFFMALVSEMRWIDSLHHKEGGVL